MMTFAPLFWMIIAAGLVLTALVLLMIATFSQARFTRFRRNDPLHLIHVRRDQEARSGGRPKAA